MFHERVIGGFGIGIPAATLIVWGLGVKGINMQAPEAAALGGLVTAVIICITDLGRRIYSLLYYAIRLMFNKDKE